MKWSAEMSPCITSILGDLNFSVSRGCKTNRGVAECLSLSSCTPSATYAPVRLGIRQFAIANGPLQMMHHLDLRI